MWLISNPYASNDFTKHTLLADFYLLYYITDWISSHVCCSFHMAPFLTTHSFSLSLSLSLVFSFLALLSYPLLSLSLNCVCRFKISSSSLLQRVVQVCFDFQECFSSCISSAGPCIIFLYFIISVFSFHAFIFNRRFRSLAVYLLFLTFAYFSLIRHEDWVLSLTAIDDSFDIFIIFSSRSAVCSFYFRYGHSLPFLHEKDPTIYCQFEK